MESLEAARVPLFSAQPTDTAAQRARALRLVIDQPVHAAVSLGRGGLGVTLAAGAAGLFGVSACTLLAQLILSAPGQLALDPLPPLFDAMAFVVPAAVGGAWLRLRVSLRVVAGAFSVGLLQAAVISASLLPLAVFIAVITDLAALSPLAHVLVASLAVPSAALLTLVHRMTETVRRLDDRPIVAHVAQGAALAVCAVFILRALSQLGG